MWIPRDSGIKTIRWKCKEHIVTKLNHHQRQKYSIFLLQKFESATCRTNLGIPQTGKTKQNKQTKKQVMNWNLMINESFGFWFLLLFFLKMSFFPPFILQTSFFNTGGGKRTWLLASLCSFLLFASYLLYQLHHLNLKKNSLYGVMLRYLNYIIFLNLGHITLVLRYINLTLRQQRCTHTSTTN